VPFVAVRVSPSRVVPETVGAWEFVGVVGCSRTASVRVELALLLPVESVAVTTTRTS
jgi:hypothetical protein